MSIPQAVLITLILAATSFSALAQEKQLLWGDTHLHTSYSFDAFLNKNHAADQHVAYRYAQGYPVSHPMHRARMQIDAPLDFLVISDHAEYYGVAREAYYRGIQYEDPSLWDRVVAWYAGYALRDMVDNAGWETFRSILPVAADPRTAAQDLWNQDSPTVPNSENLVVKAWSEATAIADEYNKPGEFTTIIGWEWSSLPGGANLHRVVMTSADGETARKFVPFGSDQSPYPEDLWAWLDKTTAETGAEFISIPHNSNISKGFMFPEDTLRGDSFTEEYLRTRLRYEPVVEMTQIKGDSETHPDLSPDDPFADFETYNAYIQQNPEPYVAQPGDYVRSGLRRGLEIEQRTGVNPYQFGVIGSTDAHTGLSTAREDSFGGKMAVDSIPENKDADPDRGVMRSGWGMSASGLAAVWADGNSREQILAAMKRREVYATSGPRIRLQMFAGWDFTEADLAVANIRDAGNARGVPMGGELTIPEDTNAAPTFMVMADRDPNGANLDRIQIVKAWLDAEGTSHERVYDVSWSGDRDPGENGQVPAVGDTVDRSRGTYTNSIGAPQLATIWVDPDFDASQSAFYYTRVLEIPTPRHSLLDALALGRESAPDVPDTVQDRAYSSPIWYRPR